MRKTTGVTKYEVEWQVLRVSLKGSLNNSEEELLFKISRAFDYFEKNKIYERWERVFNWLEGLSRGFHAKETSLIEVIQGKLNEFKNYKPDLVFSEVLYNSEKILKCDKDLLRLLWVDLFRMNKKWLLRGYFHKECNDFMDLIYNHLEECSLTPKQKELSGLRELSFNMVNSHRFFF